MQTHEIARRWTAFFEKKAHTVVPSASLVSPDPSLLFTVAGMVPFIPYFLGQQTPPYQRAVSVQKCIRTADIEEVGKTARHGTFFQMAGNFSFGDYFKHGAITRAWELLTTPKRTVVTVWIPSALGHRVPGRRRGLRNLARRRQIPTERIQRMGNEDNYWHTASPVPEAHVPKSTTIAAPNTVPGWPESMTPLPRNLNLVFMQYQLGEVRSQADFDIVGELVHKNIDTGLGMERLAMILQDVENMYETDQVRPVLDRAAELAGVGYTSTEDPQDPRFANDSGFATSQIIRSLDAHQRRVIPGNEGGGYVLRRLIRRAVRAMRLMVSTVQCCPNSCRFHVMRCVAHIRKSLKTLNGSRVLLCRECILADDRGRHHAVRILRCTSTRSRNTTVWGCGI